VPVIRHVVVFTFTPEVDEGQRDKISSALSGLVGVVPGLVAMHSGADLGLADGNGEMAVTADFADEDAWRGYMVHPAHVEVADTQIRPFLTSRAAVQFLLEA
jgi:hypothetical protein